MCLAKSKADVDGLAMREDHGSTDWGNGVENGDAVGGEVVYFKNNAQTKACASPSIDKGGCPNGGGKDASINITSKCLGASMICICH